MQLFATYTFGQALLTVLEFMLLILWIWLAITVIMDVFRSHDPNGWRQAFWLVLIVLVPLLGVIYVIARGGEMKAHAVTDQASKKLHLSPSSRYVFRWSEQGFRVGGRSYGAWLPVMSLSS